MIDNSKYPEVQRILKERPYPKVIDNTKTMTREFWESKDSIVLSVSSRKDVRERAAKQYPNLAVALLMPFGTYNEEVPF